MKENYPKEHDAHKSGQHNLRQLTIVVNGKEVVVQSNVNAPLQVAAEKALQESQNIGRPLGDWRLKFEEKVLDLTKKLGEYSLPADAVLFLSLNAGQGG